MGWLGYLVAGVVGAVVNSTLSSGTKEKLSVAAKGVKEDFKGHFRKGAERIKKFVEDVEQESKKTNNQPSSKTDQSGDGRSKKREEKPNNKASRSHDCRYTEHSRPFCHFCGRLLGGF